MRLLLLAAFAILAQGCASYTTPGRAADLSALGVTQVMRTSQTDVGVTDALSKKPLAQLPASIAVARIQAAGYHSYSADGWGRGNYCIVTTRDVETDAAVEKLSKLPQVLGVAPINRLLLPSQLDSDKELRQAAAQLHADFILVYTFDTTFHKNDLAQPLTLVTLGISPNQKASIVTTASAVLLDTRNGYVYGVVEASSRTTKMMGAWGSDDAIDESRRHTEAEAFNKLTGEIERTWTGVLRQYGTLNRPSAS